MSVTIDEQYVRNHFLHFCRYERAAFLQLVSPTVSWRIMGTIDGISGQYHSIDEFASKALMPINARLEGEMLLELTGCLVSGRRAVVELEAKTDSVKQKNGRPYPACYCWVVHYNDAGLVDELREYMDERLITELLTQNPGP